MEKLDLNSLNVEETEEKNALIKILKNNGEYKFQSKDSCQLLQNAMEKFEKIVNQLIN